MRTAFDLDNTLIRCDYPFPLEENSNRWIFKMLGWEALRKNTIKLMQILQKNKIEIWIYTSSYRHPLYLKLLFLGYGIILRGIVNRDVHNQLVTLPCSKYPPAFDIDWLIDDSKGVQREANQFNFKMILVAPDDENWYLKVLQQLKIVNCQLK